MTVERFSQGKDRTTSDANASPRLTSSRDRKLGVFLHACSRRLLPKLS